MHPTPSKTMHPVPMGSMHPVSSGVMQPMQAGITLPMSSAPLTLLFPNGPINAPITPVATEIMRDINHQIPEHFYHQPGTQTDLLCTQSGNLKQKNLISKHLPKSDPCDSLPDTSVGRNSKHVTSALSAGVCVSASMEASPCFSSSAPATSNMFQPQLPSKDISSYKSVSQKRRISLDITPKRKTERKLARNFRQQQQADIVNFAGAKFSESPQAKVVPLPPFIWCEEASSLSSCSGDEQSLSSITDVIKVKMARHGQLHETSKWNKCSPSLQVMPLHFVAVLPSS